MSKDRKKEKQRMNDTKKGRMKDKSWKDEIRKEAYTHPPTHPPVHNNLPVDLCNCLRIRSNYKISTNTVTNFGFHTEGIS
jgi:hypothetical protein